VHAEQGAGARRGAALTAGAAALLLAGERPALAYADPGSGALLWQILAGGVVGCLFYFCRITRWFRRKREKSSVD
jgi:hypothetical protein